jgi:hypothetical protein
MPSEQSGQRQVQRIEAHAHRVIERTVRAGAEVYDRIRDLPRLTRLAPYEYREDTLDTALKITARLQSALRAERNRARSGHWTYDLNRHIALRQAWLAESERLRELRRSVAG